MTLVHIELDPDTKAKLKELAALDRRSLSMYVRLLLEKHVKENPPKEDGE